MSKHVRTKTKEVRRGENEADKEVQALLQPPHWKENPFLNTLVLERFFELCDWEVLANCRLVSKLWHSESSTRWRLETVPVEIRQSTGTPESVTIWKELTDQIQAGRKPHRNFRLLNFDNLEFLPSPQRASSPPLQNDPNRAEKLAELAQNVDNFWSCCGPWIRKLELGFCTIFGSMDSFNKVVLVGTPNLKELYLNSIQSSIPSIEWINWRPFNRELTNGIENVDRPDRDQHLLQHLRIKFPFSFPISWRSLLFRFPKLQTLTLYDLVLSTDHEGRNIWHELSMICEERRRWNRLMVPIILKNVVFRLQLPVPVYLTRNSPHLTLDINTIFRHLQPSLKHVIIDFVIECWRDEDSRDFLSKIILFCGEAIRELILKVNRVSENDLNPARNFPFLLGPWRSSILKLDLKGNACQNLHFLEEFPNLEELRLEINHSDEMLQRSDLARMENVKLLELKQFRYFDDRPQVPIPEEVMTLFVTMMPKLEYFEAPLTNSLLRVVCREWKQLRELHTDCDKMRYGDRINDIGVTGIVSGGGYKLPNITDLQNLEGLSIHNMGMAGDVSVQEGFLKMPHLKSLNVDLDKTSYESFNTLVERFPLGKISRYHPGIDPKRPRS